MKHMHSSCFKVEVHFSTIHRSLHNGSEKSEGNRAKRETPWKGSVFLSELRVSFLSAKHVCEWAWKTGHPEQLQNSTSHPGNFTLSFSISQDQKAKVEGGRCRWAPAGGSWSKNKAIGTEGVIPASPLSKTRARLRGCCLGRRKLVLSGISIVRRKSISKRKGRDATSFRDETLLTQKNQIVS